MDGKLPISAVEPADNAGLGLARAIAVANVLKANPKLKNVTILPMSAAQLILPGDTITAGQAGAVDPGDVSKSGCAAGLRLVAVVNDATALPRQRSLSALTLDIPILPIVSWNNWMLNYFSLK